MRQGLNVGAVSVSVVFTWLIMTATALAWSPPVAGARSAIVGEEGRSIRIQATQSSPTFFQEITAAFTAPPTTGTLGEALGASRVSFSAEEAIEFDAVLFESGLAETTANLELYLFDPKGRLVAGGFFVSDIVAPSDRTDFFIQLSGESLVAGRFKWLMVISDTFGNSFVTPFQEVDIQ